MSAMNIAAGSCERKIFSALHLRRCGWEQIPTRLPRSSGGANKDAAMMKSDAARVPWHITALVLVLALGSLFAATRRMDHSVWFDESQTHRIASQPTYSAIAEMARQIRPYPPLFFIVVHHLLQWRPDETGLRLASALFGALCTVVVFLLGRRLSGDRAGLSAACFFALTPGAFRYFVDGNAYTLLALASTLSTLMLFRAAASGRRRDWLGYVSSALLGIATHTLFVFHAAAQLLGGFLLVRRRPGAGAYRGLIGAALALVVAATLVALFVASGGHPHTLDLARLFRIETLVSLPGMYLGPLSFGNLTMLALWCPLQALGALALFRKNRVDFVALLVVMGAALVGIAGFVSTTLYYTAYKYALGIFPLTCVVAGSALDAFRPGARRPRAAAGLAMLVYGAGGAMFIVQADADTFEFQNWRGTARYLQEAVKPGDAVVVVPKYGELPLRYYYKAPFDTVSTPDRAAAAAERLLPPGPASGATVFLALSGFANEKPLVARFTERRPAGWDQEQRRVTEALESRGLTVVEAARFLRVTVLAARRGTSGKP